MPAKKEKISTATGVNALSICINEETTRHWSVNNIERIERETVDRAQKGKTQQNVIYLYIRDREIYVCFVVEH